MKTAAAFAPPTFVVPAVVVGVGAAVAVDIISLLSSPLSGVLEWPQEEASAMRDREEIKVVESKSKHPRSVEKKQTSISRRPSHFRPTVVPFLLVM